VYEQIKEAATDSRIPFPCRRKQAREVHMVRHLGQDAILLRTCRMFWIASESPICTKRTQIKVIRAASRIIA
jgi:hypothetical protein